MLSKAYRCIFAQERVLEDYGQLSVDLVLPFLLFSQNHFVAKMVDK